MSEQVVDVRAATPAERETVWAHVSRADAWKSFGPFTSTTREREGSGDPDGPGSIRRLRIGPGGSREENLEFEPPSRLAYTLLSGLPIKDYRAEVTLTPRAGGGTAIHWHATFRPRASWTGPLFRFLITRVLTRLARGLARHSARCASPCPVSRDG